MLQAQTRLYRPGKRAVQQKKTMMIYMLQHGVEVGCQIGYVNRIDFGADLSAARQMPYRDILHAFWQIRAQ